MDIDTTTTGQPVNPADANAVHVLLVEDNAMDAVLFAGVMQQVKTPKFQIRHVGRLDEALRLCARQPFDIILLDLWLPDSDGINTLQRLFRQVTDVPIVVLTGLDDEQVALEALRHGAEDYLIKRDINNHALLSRSIRYAIERKRAEREIRKLNSRLEERVLLRTTELETVNQQLQAEIVERTRAEQALQQAIDEQRLALRAASTGHWTWHIVEDRFLWGPGVERLFGLADGDTLQGLADAIERVHPDDREVVKKGIKRALAEPGGFEAEFRVVWPNGTVRWLLGLGDVERNASGKAVRMCGISQDITQRKDAEVALRRAQRLASLGTMAAGIAHEINNPIAAVLNSAEAALIARDHPRAGPIIEECLRNVVDSAHRCGEIVSNVLKFARQEPTEKSPYDLNVLVKAARERSLNQSGRQSVVIDLDLADRLPAVQINAVAIEQVLVNLIRNAAQASNDVVRITIHTQHANGAVRLSVEDDGPGMTRHQLEHALDPFFSTRHNRGGTGLGLSIAHGIINEHGGQMEIDSELGRGTVVSIELPVGKEPE